jgi:hypothetical protein
VPFVLGDLAIQDESPSKILVCTSVNLAAVGGIGAYKFCSLDGSSGDITADLAAFNTILLKLTFVALDPFLPWLTTVGQQFCVDGAENRFTFGTFNTDVFGDIVVLGIDRSTNETWGFVDFSVKQPNTG